jgi:hypothetical protein
VVRSPTSLAREEERRKILQLEEDRRRAPHLARSTSKINRIIGNIFHWIENLRTVLLEPDPKPQGSVNRLGAGAARSRIGAR